MLPFCSVLIISKIFCKAPQKRMSIQMSRFLTIYVCFPCSLLGLMISHWLLHGRGTSHRRCGLLVPMEQVYLMYYWNSNDWSGEFWLSLDLYLTLRLFVDNGWPMVQKTCWYVHLKINSIFVQENLDIEAVYIQRYWISISETETISFGYEIKFSFVHSLVIE